MGFFDAIKSMFGGKAAEMVGDAVRSHSHGAAASPPAQAAAPIESDATMVPTGEESSDGDGFKRDYNLEAKDDSASFKIKEDLSPYYVAEFRIEQAWDDVDTRKKLFTEYGVRNEQHYYQVKATVERYISSPQAQQKYGGVGEIMHVKMKATQDYMMGGMQQKLGGELKGEVEPVEGVSLDQWAQCQVKIVSGGNLDDILRGLGIDKAKWDRVSAEWNARMSRDTTATIATAYGNAFTKASSSSGGQFSEAAQRPGQGAMPMTLEKYVEIMEAQSAGSAQGKDASQILKSFGLSILDWSNVGSWFSAYINDNALKNDAKVLNEFNALQAKYKAKYATASADSDLKF
jgi:Family of unknown function (DUF6620)